MMDQLIAIKDKLLAFWNKYTTKQKTIIICVVLAVFFAIVILSYVLTRPVYTHLASFSDASLASTLSDSLDSEGITYKMETDPSTGITSFDVEQSKYSDAVLAMGANGIVDKEMSWDDALKSDMTTSSLEKQTKITLALQSSIKENLLKFDGVEDATVIINRQEDDKKFISVVKDNTDDYAEEAICPIICEGDVIGGVILLNTADKEKMGEVELKLIQSAAGFLGRQMEQ